MLSQLIYRSHALTGLSDVELEKIVSTSQLNNKSLNITGILLYADKYFMQVLEGPTREVERLFARIQSDDRHTEVVLVSVHPIHLRRFDQWSMQWVPASKYSGNGLPVKAVPSDLIATYLNFDDRTSRILDAFIQGRWRSTPTHTPPPWRTHDFSPPITQSQSTTVTTPIPISFAFQPIVETSSGEVVAFEALIRGPTGELAMDFLNGVSTADVHRFDLESKADAIQRAAQLGIRCRLAVNLLPKSLTNAPEAVSFLIKQIRTCGIKPEQLIVELTEEEAIANPLLFQNMVRQLRASGIQIAIDDFGAGYAGLSLLAEFQPDILKIDKKIIQGVAANGPRQAIVRAIVEFCICLGIRVIAEGIENQEDWQWLESAGVHWFQGNLYAEPGLNQIPTINWPLPHKEFSTPR
jgi:EAL domain-containing protein (putative c-di-GMP-specific phosphodiesterase class I)